MRKESGYWQIMTEEEAIERLAIFVTYENQWCNLIPMVELNAYPLFVSMMEKLQNEW